MEHSNESLQINEKIRNCLLGDYETELKRLERNISEDGCIHDPILIWNNVIVDGHLRYEIAHKHQLPFTTKELDFENEEEAIQYRALKQLEKRNSNDFQRAAIAIKLFKPKLEKEAELRMKAGKNDPELNSTQGSTQGSTRNRLADIAGVSTDTIRKVEEILKYASEKTKREAEMGKISIHAAHKEVYYHLKVLEFKRIGEDILNLGLPDGLFDVIVVDPPWQMAKLPYPSMGLDEIRDLYIPAKEDAIVFLWTVHKYLPDAFEILNGWGFTYKHCFVWDKQLKGRGHYALESVEFVLLCVVGKPKYLNSGYSDIISERRRKHSQKPEAFYEMINTVCVGRKIDMFGREKRDGFELWGPEADNSDKNSSDDDNNNTIE